MEPRSSPQDHLNSHRFTETISRVRERTESDSHCAGLSLQELTEIFGPKGHFLFTLFLILPFLQPIPLPGLSTLIGLAIAMGGAFLALDRPPWLPKRLAEARLSQSIALRICSGLEKLLKRLERMIRPRGVWIFELNWLKRLNGVVILIYALFLSLPLPIPFSNFFPALVLLLVSLASLEEDIILLSIGYLAALIALAFFIALVLVPYFSWDLMANG